MATKNSNKKAAPAAPKKDVPAALTVEGASQPPIASAPANTYEVKQPLRYNGDKFAIGDTVEMEPADAETLVLIGTLAELNK